MRLDEAALEGRFEIKAKIIGFGTKEVREEHRLIRVTNEGWETQADQRHSDIIIEIVSLTDTTGGTSPCEQEERRWGNEGSRITDCSRREEGRG